MPAYDFKAKFAWEVQAGLKAHTIRPKRKRPTVAGDKLKLYTGMRTKRCVLLLDTFCREVKPMEIYHDRVVVLGREIDKQELTELAVSDGFDSASAFFDFFRATYKLSPDNPLLDMELIEWYPPHACGIIGKISEAII